MRVDDNDSLTTRETILFALAKVIASRGVTEFSVQTVADEAGISHRTVYRYFPNRETLLEGLAGYLDQWQAKAGMPGTPESLEQLVEVVPRLFAFFDEHSDLVGAMVLASLAIGIEPEPRRTRTESFFEMLLKEFPELDESEIHAWGYGLRMMASSQTWFTLTKRFHLSPAMAARIATNGLEAMIERIRTVGAEAPGSRP